MRIIKCDFHLVQVKKKIITSSDEGGRLREVAGKVNIPAVPRQSMIVEVTT